MIASQLSIEQKTERLRAHWQKVVGDASSKGQVTSDLLLVMNELENPNIHIDILKIWVQLTAESTANPSVSAVVKSALLNSYLRNALFAEKGTPQFQSLDALFDFWKSVIVANRNNVQVAVSFAFKLLLASDGTRKTQIETLSAVESIKHWLWGTQFDSFSDAEVHFETHVLSPLRSDLAALPVDLQHFEIKVSLSGP